MKSALRPRVLARRLQRGAMAVEFALVSALFLMTLLVGIIELGRAFFYINATVEATRLGARLAVVCDKSDAQEAIIKDRMIAYVSVLNRGDIQFDWSPNRDCQANATPICTSVTVRILPNAKFDTFIPYVPLRWTLPEFATTLPRESMSGTPTTNPMVCN